MTISEVAGGVHSSQVTSQKSGLAFDVSLLKGKAITGNSDQVIKFQKAVKLLGGSVLSECSQLHVKFNAPQLRAELS